MFNVKDYGALGNGQALDSVAIQKAIDACSQAGGGTVYIPEGKYLCGTMHLKSNIHVWLDKGALILGSLNREDFDPYEENPTNCIYQDRSHSYFHHSLFHADNANDIALTGFGKIDMQSAWEDLDFSEFGNGQGQHWCRGCKAIAFKECTNVVIRDLVIRNVTDLAVYFAGCENVTVSGLNILSHVDGISPDCCKNVIISDCIVTTGDDSIVPKSSYTLGRFQAMENLTIANCVIRSSNAAAIKFGTESNAAYINSTITGCTIYDTDREGITLMSADGARIEGVAISNITMRNVAHPILLMISERLRGPEGSTVGEIKNVSISNVMINGPYPETVEAPLAQNSKDHNEGNLTKKPIHLPCLLIGLPESPIRNVSLSNVQFVAPGGGTEADRNAKMNEVRKQYPQAFAYGKKAPVYGLFARDVDNLRLYNVDFTTDKPDARDAMFLEHVSNYKNV